MEEAKTDSSPYLLLSPAEWVKSPVTSAYDAVGVLAITKGGRLEFRLLNGEVIVSVPAALTQREYMQTSNKIRVRVGSRLYRFKLYGSNVSYDDGGGAKVVSSEKAFVEAWQPVLEETVKLPPDDKEIIAVPPAPSNKKTLQIWVVFIVLGVMFLPLLSITAQDHITLAMSFSLYVGTSMLLSWALNLRFMRPTRTQTPKTPSPEATLPPGTPAYFSIPSVDPKKYLTIFGIAIVIIGLLFPIAYVVRRISH
jgi:hypothetical protein